MGGPFHWGLMAHCTSWAKRGKNDRYLERLLHIRPPQRPYRRRRIFLAPVAEHDELRHVDAAAEGMRKWPPALERTPKTVQEAGQEAGPVAENVGQVGFGAIMLRRMADDGRRAS